MEQALLKLEEQKIAEEFKSESFNSDQLSVAISKLVDALYQIQRSYSETKEDDGPSSSSVNAQWLIDLCSQVPSELGAAYLARAVWEASQKPDETQQQNALFDALGASDEAMNVLMEVASQLDVIRKNIAPSDLSVAGEVESMDQFMATTSVDPEEQRRQRLRQEAMDAAEVAAITKAEADALGSSALGAVTHTVTRASDAKAIKTAAKAAKRAAQAMKRAKDAGAIVDEDELMTIDKTEIGEGGLMGTTQEQLWNLQNSLLPEGSRQLYEKQSLPQGTIREYDNNLERVIIPAARQDTSKLHPRLKIHEIMDRASAQAFSGTNTLNPMQSTVFEAAYNTQNNLLICAPTGAGKTNVAMLTVVAHLRNIGLIGDEYTDSIGTGRKIIYIAPMKALAQEVVEKFSSKLKSLKIIVRELTGDMQLTRAAAEAAHIIVTTPEKWDVVTRKSGTDENSLGNQCGLLIIDEVHLLADERGAVIESVVSRTHRLVESRQRQVRIVALSATLPNYKDVAEFLQVPERGLFFFGPEYRPVPLQQQFIGVIVKTKDRFVRENAMNDACYDVVLDSIKRGHQVMVFVHSRKGTGDTAGALAERAQHMEVLEKYFITKGAPGTNGEAYKRYVDRVKKARSREVGIHFENGMGIHHAGMLRGDRKLTEQMFTDGAIKVLVCTATLAWGVNLPSYTVVIKGTEVYNAEKGGNVDLSILDVQQIFGRAGRPQFDTSGEATLITNHESLKLYLDKLVLPVPIESNFIKQLADHLNAEVVGGTVTNIQEASNWLTYTYLYVRMLRNPIAYGINADKKADDPMLLAHCRELVTNAAKLLTEYQMLRYNSESGNLSVAERGRVAAHFYLQAESVANFDEILEKKLSPTDSDLLLVICSATEFTNMKVRQEELSELGTLARTVCPMQLVRSDTAAATPVGTSKGKNKDKDPSGESMISDSADKVFILMQALIARAKVKSFTLISDLNYVSSNAARVARAIFEMCIKESKAGPAIKLLRIAKSVDNQIWWFQTPLRHFDPEIDKRVFVALENKRSGSTYDTFQSALDLLDMRPDEVGQLCRSFKEGSKIQRFVSMLPKINISCRVLPITSSVLIFQIQLDPSFEWNGRWHGGAQSFWLWIEDGENNRVYHHEYVTFTKRTHPEAITLSPAIPAFDPLPKQYYLRLVSDSWVGIETLYPISIHDIKMPTQKTPYTDLQDLTPLPTSALGVSKYEELYGGFETFNPIQTQLFHVLYHTDSPVFLGAPTGSGKTMVAELAILRMKRIHPKGVCVYIAPLKSLARERLREWRQRLGSAPLFWKVLELSGDTHYGQHELDRADILVCTPEKWDLISRGWRGSIEVESFSHGKDFIRRVRLLVIDEIHLLGEERGAVLEAIVSRTRFISRHMEQMNKSVEVASTDKTGDNEMTRIIGLSTALANPHDLADWIGIQTTGFGPNVGRGLYNFRPSVRPVPTVVHIQGFAGRHYCPRMATMNKPCYAAIKDYSPNKPVLIFVASRRQTRLTAFDIISYAAADENPKRFLGCSEDLIESVAEQIYDEALRHTITFGIGLHHAGLASSDRSVVEKMFLNGDIKVLVATATLAWGLNTPSHLVIVKGTEYYDGKTSRYVDYPLTDVLQMIGRAGRPGFDTEGIAVVMVAEDKKNFYKKFLYSPFPVESHLMDRLCENLNAEIAIGTVNSVIDALGYLTWTFFSRRVKANPSYYGAPSDGGDDVEEFLLSTVKDTVKSLHDHGCVERPDENDITPTPLGLASAKFYLSYKTPKQMQLGVREGRKIVATLLEGSDGNSSQEDVSAHTGHAVTSKLKITSFTRDRRVDEIASAWLLHVLASTHEFDELPVRHNEEYLNEELSEDVTWGPDTRQLLSPEKRIQYDFEIFSDPHTKCFLLLQAYLQGAKLPISDYVNDTSTVVENVPRLLAALEFIAIQDMTTSGAFELICQFPKLRQIFHTKSMVHDDPLLQVPGMDEHILRRLQKEAKPNATTNNDTRSNGKVSTIRELRSLSSGDAGSLLRRLMRRPAGNIDDTLNFLYSIPIVSIKDAEVKFDIDKVSQKNTGTLKISYAVLLNDHCAQNNNNKGKNKNNNAGRRKNQNGTSDSPMTMAVVVGTYKSHQLLGHTTVSIPRSNRTENDRQISVSFDWDLANADGGEGCGHLLVRLLMEEIRGFDVELTIPLK